MIHTPEKKNQNIMNLLNGTISAFRHVAPLPANLGKPEACGRKLELEFGVMIGITGEIKGKLVLTGKPHVFQFIGEEVFAMPIEEGMLSSFSGEFGNMVAGNLSTNMTGKGIHTDITSPVIFQGNTVLTGHEKSLCLPFTVEKSGRLDIYLLVNE